MSSPVFNFNSKVWIWQSNTPGSWHFVSLPKTLSSDIKELFHEQSKGFGSLKVEATIGSTSWKTSIFPDNKRKSYLLPIKKAVRDKEKIVSDKSVKVTIEILLDDL
ncbi:MAG: DUF1905 domain-containing protein [Acidimicrobiia bacterium]